jgi:hypothetical protein
VKPAVALALILWAKLAFAQTATLGTLTHSSNLRPDPSTAQAPTRLLKSGEELTLLSATPEHGFYHVRTADGQEGWVWSRNIRLAAPAAAPSPPAGTRGSASETGCGDGLWQHVYHPTRLLVKQSCTTVTGVIVDATLHQPIHQPDGVRHEPDGDTHGWLKVDPPFQKLLAPGNISHEGGNLIFEIVCRYPITQADAKPACVNFKDNIPIPPVGSHVAITGSFVQDLLHNWNEIHPVSTIKVQ